MGRSQVKFRTTHGRGRGRGAGAGTSSSSGRGDDASSGRRGRRPLESNAFRYAEEHGGDDNDDNDKQLERDDNDPNGARAYGFRRQFFAGEENARDAGATPSGAYFQSRTMKQWDTDDVEDDKSAVGVLDLNWISEQLALVAPSVRYQLDPKYCVDFAFEPQEDEADEADAKEALVAVSAPAPASVSATTAVDATSPPGVSRPAASAAAVPVATASVDSELDLLLQLSSLTPQASAAPPSLSSAAPTATAAAAHVQQSNTAEQLEDWLDDVLDM